MGVWRGGLRRPPRAGARHLAHSVAADCAASTSRSPCASCSRARRGHALVGLPADWEARRLRAWASRSLWRVICAALLTAGLDRWSSCEAGAWPALGPSLRNGAQTVLPRLSGPDACPTAREGARRGGVARGGARGHARLCGALRDAEQRLGPALLPSELLARGGSLAGEACRGQSMGRADAPT